MRSIAIVAAAIASAVAPTAAQTAPNRATRYLFQTDVQDGRAVWVNPAGTAAIRAASVYADVVVRGPGDSTRLAQITAGFSSQGLAFGYQYDDFDTVKGHTYRLGLAGSAGAFVVGAAAAYYRGNATDWGYDFGVLFRASRQFVLAKRLGFSYSTDREAAVSVVEKSVEAARWVDRDEYLELPGPSDSGNVEIFDPGIISTSEEEAVKKVSLLEGSAYSEDKRIRNIKKARGTFRNSDMIIINSKGVDRQYSSTTCTAQIMAMADNGQDSQMGWYFMGSRFLNEVSFEDVGKYAAKRAIQLLGSKRMNAQKTPVVLDNSVAVEFMGIFASSLSSESVQKGKSLLSGKKGKKVISPKINMVDNGLIPGRLGSRPVDDEGVPSQDKTLIKEGVLSGYLYNTYTAKKEGVSSTGNAVRSSFAGLPSVGLSNLYLDAASKSDVLHIGDILKTVDKCLYVTEAMGVHTANPISGEFSVGVSGLWVEKGEIAFPVPGPGRGPARAVVLEPGGRGGCGVG